MKLSALIAPLIKARAPHDQIMAVVEAYESQQQDALEKRRQADAERQSRKRNKDKSRDVTLGHSDRLLVRGRDTRADDKPIKHTIEPEEKNTAQKDHAEFRSVLSELDADRMSALIKHRKAKRAQMSGHAARLFLSDVKACGLTLADAVDTCISRNWITVKPDWIAKQAPRGSPAPKGAGLFFAEAERIENERNARQSWENGDGNRRDAGGFPFIELEYKSGDG